MPVIATTPAAPARSLTTQRRYTDLTGPLPAGVTAARITAMIGQATSLIEDYCGRVFARERVTEAIYGAQLRQLVLERSPILTVHGITLNGLAVDADRYEVEDPGAGIIRFKSAARWGFLAEVEYAEMGYAERVAAQVEDRYEVDYTGGWVPNGWPVTDPVTPVTLPAALELACVTAVESMLNGASANAGIQSEKLGDMSRTYRDDAGRALSDHVTGMLAPYRRLAI